jgi:hypothetical protein
MEKTSYSFPGLYGGSVYKVILGHPGLIAQGMTCYFKPTVVMLPSEQSHTKEFSDS